MTPSMLDWDDLRVGARLRTFAYQLTQKTVDDYRRSVGDVALTLVDGVPVAPPTILTFPMLQAIDHTWSPRPGLVHTTQTFRWTQPLPVGAELTIDGVVDQMYLRRARRYFSVATEVRDARGLIATGQSIFLYPEGDES